MKDWECHKVNGKALCAKSIYDDNLAEVSVLCERQEADMASLLKDPVEALNAIRETLIDLREIDSDEGAFAPRAALEILNQLTANDAMDDSPQMNHALF